MPQASRTALVLTSLALATVAGVASARSMVKFESRFQQSFVPNGIAFNAGDPPVGEAVAPSDEARPTGLQGSTIGTFQKDLLVIDEDSGELVRTDADGKKVASLRIGRDAAQLVVDEGRERAYVSDRLGDRIVVVDLRNGLVRDDVIPTRTEPFGVALSPDRKTLLVTTVADRELTAFDPGTGREKWSVQIGPEPRGIAISPDGTEALVTFLTTGVVGRVQLGDSPKVDYVAIDPPPPSGHLDTRGNPTEQSAPKSRDRGQGFARNAFAAIYVGHAIGVVPHQISTPFLGEQDVGKNVNGYGGGGFQPPVAHRLAFLKMPDGGQSSAIKSAFAATSVHQPRAVAYDTTRDVLYVAGYGSDDLLAIADVSQASARPAWPQAMSIGSGCGPSGLTVDAEAGDVHVWCSLTREVVRVSIGNDGLGYVASRSGELTKSQLSAAARRGKEIFRKGNDGALSQNGAMACASCHAEARSDGLSWFLQGNRLQTPFLAGRLVGSHPFKWDGKDTDLDESLTNTVKRLGGFGLNSQQVDDLQAFLTSLEPPRAPATEDADAVARGKALFESDATRCASCHNGPLLTDGKRHTMSADLGRVDTPSLIGLAHSAPYYHDGSAATLEALLKGNANIHGMGRISKLTESQIDDLVSYLQTL